MATVRPVELATDDTAVARRSRAERSKLRRELGRLDVVALLISAIVLVVPADRLTGLTGFIDALATVFTVYGPWSGPAGGLSATALATGWSALALAAALWPGLGTGDPTPTCPTASPATASASPWPSSSPWRPCCSRRRC